MKEQLARLSKRFSTKIVRKMMRSLPFTLAQLTVAIALVQLIIVPGLPTRFGAANAFEFKQLFWFVEPSDSGEEFCVGASKDGDKSKAGYDSCFNAMASQHAGWAEDTASIAFMLAGVTCTLQCATVWTIEAPWCSIASYGAVVVDLGGAFIFAMNSMDYAKALEKTTGGWGMLIGRTLGEAAGKIAFEQIGKWIAEKLAEEGIKKAAEGVAKETAQKAAEKSAENYACWFGAGFNYADGLYHRSQAAVDYDDAKGYRKKQGLQTDDRFQHYDVAAAQGKAGDAQQSTPPEPLGDPRPIMRTTDPGKRADAALQSAMAAGMGPILDNLQQHGFSPKEFFQKAYEGKSPFQAFAETANSVPGAADMAKGLEEISKELAKKPELLSKAIKDIRSNAGINFASMTAHPSGGAKKSSGAIDFGAMFGQKEGGKAGGPTALKLGIKGPAYDTEGFYPAAMSIFEVVGTRYSSLSPRVNAGENILGAERGVVRTPATEPAQRVPENPYLGR